MMHKALAPATLSAYNRSLVAYQNFCAKYSLSCAFPISIDNLSCFIQFLFNTGLPASSIASSLSALSYYHKLWAYEAMDPTKAFSTTQLMVAIRKERPTSDGRKPISENILLTMFNNLARLNLSYYELSLFRAMFFLMFHFGLRVGEVTNSPHNINNCQLEIVGDRLRLTFSTYKHSPAQPFSHFIRATDSLICPVPVLARYASLRGNCRGPFFMLGGNAVTRDLFNSRLRETLVLCHLDTSSYSSHSFRIGAASLWAAKGLSYDLIRRLGRWKSSAGLKYLRHDIDHTIS